MAAEPVDLVSVLRSSSKICAAVVSITNGCDFGTLVHCNGSEILAVQYSIVCEDEYHHRTMCVVSRAVCTMNNADLVSCAENIENTIATKCA